MTRSTPALTAVPDPDDDGADEVAILPAEQRGETPTEVLGAPDEDVPLAVDPPKGSLTLAELTGIDLPEHKVVVPRWMKSRADAKAVALWCVRYIGNLATFHVTRTPLYAWRVIARTVVGAWRTVTAWWAWQWDTPTMRVWLHEMWLARQSKGDTDHSKEARAHRKAWSTTVTHRAIGAAMVLFLLVTAVTLAYFYAPPWATALALIGGLVVLVKVGAPEDQPLIEGFYTSKPGQSFRLTSTMIVKAIGALGIGEINKALRDEPKTAIAFPQPIKTDGPGFRADIDLPHGVTAAMIMEKRPELASGLRRPLGTVWPRTDSAVHAGRLVLWVGNQELSTMKPPKAPYTRSDWTCDAFGNIPFGFDQRGERIEFDLMYGNMLIGALPGAGKTAAIRGMLLALSLDPTVEFRIAEHKGSGDLSMFEPMSHFYVSGVTDEDIELTVQMLRDVLNEIERRAKQVKHLGATSDLAPESKVTRKTANMRHLGLHPMVVVLDEAHEVFTHPDYGKEAGKLAERGIKRGRAFGVSFIFSTQRPDANSIPTGISGNVSHRFCLRVTGQVENDIILGVSSYKHGHQATTLTQRDKGVGILKGAFDDPVVTRTYYFEKPEAEAIAKRALAARRDGGYITGMAAGEQPERPPSYSLLDDLNTIFVKCQRAGYHSETVCDELRKLRPDAYADWTPNTLAAALPDNLETTQLSLGGRNRRGLRKDAVKAAIASRDLPSIEGGER